LLSTGLLIPSAARLDAFDGDETRASDAPLGIPTSEADSAAAARADWPDLAVANGDPAEATLKALEALGGMKRFVKPDHVVAIKPNASFATPPEWGATTHPDVLAAVIESCLNAGARRVLVIDHTMTGAERCFKITGTAKAVAKFSKAKLVSLDNQKTYRPVGVPGGKALHNTEVPAVLQKTDVFINLPTAKSHSATGVSLGMKNLMGLVWDRHRFHNDMDLHQGVADLATVLRPHLIVLDAMSILKTNGPTGPGDVYSFNGVVAGVDQVAVDAYGAGLSTWNGSSLEPGQIRYIRHAADHGLGVMNLEELKIEKVS
jgi:uncharacterized protein (DUF362 family)